MPETQLVKSKRILIVEDNSVNQMVAQNMLKNFGYHADVAANGREALTALEIIPYDLVLMDCQMPEMDGYEATREIRAREWQPKYLPIIALTAHATAGEREKCLHAGMDDYISKPVEKENLRQTLAHWLERSNAENSVPLETTQNTENKLFVSVVDFATLDDITDYDAEMKREVVETYLEQTVINLSELERAITVNDARKLYEVAHKSVGGSALCGMTAIVEPMRKLEQLGREGKVRDALPFLSQAQDAFAAIDKECRENIAGI
jgi:CheY-like chemotaxis protein/HPt (histidine-containing phosphotransfer) domain-containing protein